MLADHVFESAVQELIQNAEKSESADAALKFSQAANNVANTRCSLLSMDSLRMKTLRMKKSPG